MSLVPVALLSAALAHDLQPGVVALQEAAPGVYDVRLTPPRDGGSAPPLRPQWPRTCTPRGDQLHCADGLSGVVVFPGLADRRVKLVVHVTHSDGASTQQVLTEGQDRLQLGAPATPAWARLGLTHVLAGLDHILFVSGLAVLAAGPRRGLLTLTAFTLGHAVALGACALDLVPPAGPALELLIAASVLLLARDVLHQTAEPTLTQRQPAVAAGLFGIIHGVGFAGGLLEVGVPNAGLAAVLLRFHIGVEAAQAMIWLGALSLLALSRRAGLPAALGRRAVGWVMGIAAGSWTLTRAWEWGAHLVA